MKKIFFFAAIAAALLSTVSCDPLNEKKKGAIDNAVLHVQYFYEFQRPGVSVISTYSTSFESLDVKAVCKIGGQTDTNPVTTKTWSKDYTITSFPAEVELSSKFSLKSSCSTPSTLPDKLTAEFTTTDATIEINTATVDYYSGSTLVKTGKINFIPSGSFSRTGGYKAKEKGLAATQAFLEKKNATTFSAIILAE